MADEKSPLPAPSPARQPPLDRQALERVLARAAELQGASSMPESGDLISESQLLEIGNDVGLSPEVLNQALAEERTRINVPEERGLVAQIAGAGFATATRSMPGCCEKNVSRFRGASPIASHGSRSAVSSENSAARSTSPAAPTI